MSNRRDLDISQKLLDTRAVSLILGVNEGALRRWRVERIGPPYIKVGRSVRYHPDHIQQWLADNLTTHPTVRSGY